jgi:hypothetical protein
MARYLKQVEELGRQVEQWAGAEVRAQVMAGSEALKASSKPADIAHWVQGAMQRLDALVDEETRCRIMRGCGYNCAHENSTPIARAVARRKKYATLDAFLEAEQRKPPVGTRLVREGNVLYQFYTPQSFTYPMRCYCSLVKGLPAGETTSLTYCQCSQAFVEKYWEAILERPIQVQLLESCIAGAAECKFAVQL